MPSNTGSKSAKAIKAASKGRRGASAPKLQQIPWIAVLAVAIVVLFIGGIAWHLTPKIEAASWKPTADNHDPSLKIDGVKTASYPKAIHVGTAQRVAYDIMPPMGGPHDAIWATCTGTIYEKPVRTENMVHTMEHGAVWIAYNPDKLGADGVAKLKSLVDGQPYMVMSPFPGLDHPLSLQAWGHQLRLDSPDDKRIKEFISALRLNQYTAPEIGASCSTQPGAFDPANPPAFDPSPYPADAVKMDGAGADVNKTVAPPAPAAPPAEPAPAAPPAEPAPAPAP